jgi:cathepsin X
VYAWAHTNGLQHSSCEQYVAKNLDHSGDCEAIDQCRDCSPPAGFFVEPTLDDCYAVEDTKYYIGDHYSIQGEDAMKTEIFMNGPISCGIHVSDDFEVYTGGIYSEVI